MGRPDDLGLRAGRAHLVADCARCRALCCVGPAFARSADFPITKPAGTPCPNLGADHRCTVHDHLLRKGFRGCVGYDCLGAGQHLVAGGVPDGAAHELLPVVRLLGELAWYLTEVLALPAASREHGAARTALRRATALRDDAAGPAADAGALRAAAEALRGEVAPVLQAASLAVRTAAGGEGPDRAGADLAGRDLRGAGLRRGTLRGAVLLGADLRGADLREADLLGADTRGVDLRGADLRGALFVTRTQLDAARGDAATRLPAWADRPGHWAAASGAV